MIFSNNLLSLLPLLLSAICTVLAAPAQGFVHHSNTVSVRNLLSTRWYTNIKTPDRAFTRRLSFHTRLFADDRKRDYDDEEDEDDDGDSISLENDDWRAFRARLVKEETKEKSLTGKAQQSQQEQEQSQQSPSQGVNQGSAGNADLDGIGSLFEEQIPSPKMAQPSTSAADEATRGMTPLDPSQWAYDSGDIIEQGAVILGGVEQQFGFGLRQQYFHKAAILVLDHVESTFTKGIILNRPTDLFLEDDMNEGVKWRVWFGGDVQGLNSKNPDIVCLHSLKDIKATRASIPVINGIHWTTFDNAKRLVKAGVAESGDFWVFVGYAGWAPMQLAGELQRNSWYMVATDSQTLLKELARQSQGADPRGAGLEMWTLLMNMIGRSKTAQEYSGAFDDLMLKEWAFKNLLSSAAGGGAGRQQRTPDGFNVFPELVDELMSKVAAPGRKPASHMEGSLVRASSAERSPFLLDNQELHKAVVLIISDDDAVSVGAILNRPAAKGMEIMVNSAARGTRKVSIPLRFGGPYSVKGKDPMLWLHCSSSLRKARIGSPIGNIQQEGIWKCTLDDVKDAIGRGIGSPEDFIVVSGVSVWTKTDGLGGNGIEGALSEGMFEPIPSRLVDSVWSVLLKQQQVLSNVNMMHNLILASEAWACASANAKSLQKQEPPPIGGLGQGFDEEDSSLVFESDVKVSKLSDDALRSWVATFLLGAPSLGE
jgi:putative AlgH/UPF0301 family transcriptional regulator